MLTLLTRRRVALAAAVALCLGVCAPAASAAESAADSTQASAPATAAKAAKTTDAKASDSPAKGTTTTGDDDGDDTITRKVAAYKNPGLSSAPSSNEPGLSYAARGLSSQIVDPLGGIITLSMVALALLLIEDVYLQMENTRVLQSRMAGKPDEVVPLSSRVTSELIPQDVAAALNGLSSQLPR